MTAGRLVLTGVAATLALALALALAACGAAPASSPPSQAPVGDSTPAGATPAAASPDVAAAPALPVATTADVELPDATSAVVHGARVAFDGIEEGLAWPALDKALPPRKSGDVITLQVARAVPVVALLRAAWTLRRADLHVQSQDASGGMHAVALRARRDGAVASGCHLAVFLRADGSLRVASPGGPVSIAGDDPAASFARSLADERAKCPIRYVAFGAESDSAPWGPVFDVLLAIDTAKAAGDARYVLAQAMHAAPGKD